MFAKKRKHVVRLLNWFFYSQWIVFTLSQIFGLGPSSGYYPEEDPRPKNLRKSEYNLLTLLLLFPMELLYWIIYDFL